MKKLFSEVLKEHKGIPSKIEVSNECEMSDEFDEGWIGFENENSIHCHFEHGKPINDLD